MCVENVKTLLLFDSDVYFSDAGYMHINKLVDTYDQFAKADIVILQYGYKHYILKNRYGASVNFPTKQELHPELYEDEAVLVAQQWLEEYVPGYHLTEIPKGEYGKFSKIKEEFLELEDAVKQGSIIHIYVELADLYGAIEAFMDNEGNGTMEDLKEFSDITKRAFVNGRRS